MKNIIIATLSILVSVYSFGQVDRSIVPEPGPAPEINIPNPVVFDLDNGMKVILSSDHRIPKVSINLVMGSDPRVEGNKAGLSSLTGSLILSGTDNKSKDEIDLEKDFIGADLVASSDNIYLSVLTKHLDKGLELMTDVMQNANFPESEFDRIKKQFESGIYSSKTEPTQMMGNALNKVIFGSDHPYGEVMTEETLDNITRQDVIDFYKKQFTPAGSYLVIVGDINETQAKELANNHFGNWEGGLPYKNSYEHGIYPENNRVFFVEKPGAVQSVISVSFPIDMMPGHEDQIKTNALNKIFGGAGFGSRLMQNLREDKAYTYGAYSTVNVKREGSYINASGNFRNEVTDSAITQFIYEIERITKDFVGQDELDLNKASLAGNFARSLESSRTIANFALNSFRNDLPADYYQTYLQKLSAVSKEDVLAMAKKYFRPNNLNIIVVGSKDVLDNLKQFATSGEVEILDAFGDPAVDVEYQEADITKKEVLENYLMAITKTTSWDKAVKKIESIKTMTVTSGVHPQQAPVELNMVQHFAYPNKSASKLDFNGMVLSEDAFNGTAGYSKMANETGGLTKKELDAEEVLNKRKTGAVFTEYSLLCNLDDLEMLGIVHKNNKDLYAIKYVMGNSTVTEYYDVDSFLKRYTERLEKSEEGAASISAIYTDYTTMSGFLFPKNTTQLIESAGMDIKIKSVDINKKIDDKVFKVD